MRGTATRTVRATDTGGLFNEKSLTITVNNVDRAPVVAAIANQTWLRVPRRMWG